MIDLFYLFYLYFLLCEIKLIWRLFSLVYNIIRYLKKIIKWFKTNIIKKKKKPATNIPGNSKSTSPAKNYYCYTSVFHTSLHTYIYYISSLCNDKLKQKFKSVSFICRSFNLIKCSMSEIHIKNGNVMEIKIT